MAKDFTVYFAATPNGRKIPLAMKEMGMTYELKVINLQSGEQKSEEFLKISPNGKIPAIVDHTEGDLCIFESGAILEYLAEKSGKFGGGPDRASRYAVKQWLYWQVGGFGPMVGQAVAFGVYSKEDVPAAKEKFRRETVRLFSVMDTQLATNTYIAGEEYSIADMALYFWSLVSTRYSFLEECKTFANVKRWQDLVGAREAVKEVEAM